MPYMPGQRKISRYRHTQGSKIISGGASGFEQERQRKRRIVFFIALLILWSAGLIAIF